MKVRETCMRTVETRMPVRFLAVPTHPSSETFSVYDAKRDMWISNDISAAEAIKLANTMNWKAYANLCKKYIKAGIAFANYGISNLDDQVFLPKETLGE